MVGSWFTQTAFLGLLVLSAACSTPLAERFSCSNSDWYEIGRRDGASGAPLERLEKYREQCGKRLEVDSEDMYRNGRNAGLVEYCTGRNGFELGRMRVIYNSVCPTTAEQAFLKAYERGVRARNIEIENKKLDTRIEQLVTELTGKRGPATADRSSVNSELENLKTRRAANEEELTKISK